jgi:hypothetical protein
MSKSEIKKIKKYLKPGDYATIAEMAGKKLKTVEITFSEASKYTNSDVIDAGLELALQRKEEEEENKQKRRNKLKNL